MNLRDLTYLVAVADHRHFGRAAEACYVSQPTLSAQIKKLEAELGVQLVERNPRHVMMTAVGREVVERARSVLREVTEIEDLARSARDPEAGSLRLGIFPTLAPYLLPHVVPSLSARFPDLELLLVEAKTESVLARLRDGSLDVGILALPIPEEGLRTVPLFTEDFVLAVPEGHPLAAVPEPVDPAVLDGTSVLLLEDGHCLRDQALEVCGRVGATERGGFRATSLETLRQMVGAGVGVTLLPELAVRPPVASPEGIRLLRFAEPVPHRRIAMVWRAGSAYDAFLPRLAQVFADLPDGYVHPVADPAWAPTAS